MYAFWVVLTCLVAVQSQAPALVGARADPWWAGNFI